MPKKTSAKRPPIYLPEDLVDPLAWINLRTYAQLKEWLREATRQQIFLPVVIPNNVMPASYLAQLLMQSDEQIKTYLQTIIPELIKEWGTHSNPRCLDDLLILCGNLNCNEAETPISQIITGKLTDKPSDTELRLRALSVLQEIGTDRSLHIFKRYIGDFEYAALCYRSLYLLNLNYAVTELQGLMRLYHSHNAADEMEDVLKILFKYTLKRPEYICVLQPLVEQTPPEFFVEALELLHSIGIVNEDFFLNLTSNERVEMVKQMMKRARKEEECERISNLLSAVGAKLEPPPIPIPGVDTPASPKTKARPKEVPRKRYVRTKTGYFLLTTQSPSTGNFESVPVIADSDIGQLKSWAFIRDVVPDQSHIMSLLDQSEM